MALPTAYTAGYSLFRSEVGCDCLIEWLQLLERLCVLKGYIKYRLDILQLTGGYALSGGTHYAGGVFDIKQYDRRIVALAREMGAPATWMRDMPYADGSPGNTHTHGVLSGCPHNLPGRYQITAQARGYNGMGKGTVYPYVGVWGYGGKDSHADPVTYRSWSQGIAWAKAEIVRITAENILGTPLITYTATTTEENELMATLVQHPVTGAMVPLADALWSMWTYILEARNLDQRAADKVWARAVSRGTSLVPAIQELADAKSAATSNRVSLAALTLAVKGLAEAQNLDGDALALAVAAIAADLDAVALDVDDLESAVDALPKAPAA